MSPTNSMGKRPKRGWSGRLIRVDERVNGDVGGDEGAGEGCRWLSGHAGGLVAESGARAARAARGAAGGMGTRGGLVVGSAAPPVGMPSAGFAAPSGGGVY